MCDLHFVTSTPPPGSILNMYYSTWHYIHELISFPFAPLPLKPKNPQFSIYHVHDAANAIALLHDLKGLVDVLKWLAVCDELVDFQFSCHVVINETRQLGATFDASESTSLHSR